MSAVRNTLPLRFGFLATLIISLFGCSGDGGGEEGDSLRTDACAVLGIGRVINGTPCKTERSPVVRVIIAGRNNETALCSGSVISPRHVLTAGHCFEEIVNREVSSITVATDQTKVYQGVEYTVHPEFGARAVPPPAKELIFNDLAIVEVDQPMDLPVIPLLVSQGVKATDKIAIFGYGLDEKGGIGVLESGEMRVSGVTVDHVITSFNGRGSNTCVGDSGGPAILQVGDGVGAQKLGIVGVTSSGIRDDCKSGDVSYFANVQSPSYLEFIRSVVPGVQLQ